MKKAKTLEKGIENVFFMQFMISCLPVKNSVNSENLVIPLKSRRFCLGFDG
jgi:hypothetical protein